MWTRRAFIGAVATLPLALKAAQTATAEIPPELYSDFSKRLRPVGRILELENYYVWCNAPIESPDGRTHVFFSRWPKAKGMGGWISSSEIAHAVAPSPEGPYEVTGMVLAPRGAGFWDGTTCHNPHIVKVDGRYALFYMGNSNGRTNTKRVGLALADSLDGPWQRPAAPLLEAGAEGAWDDHCTTNPSFIKHPNGQYWLYYKSWNTADYEAGKPPVRGNRKYGLAIAEKLEGPYRKHPQNPLIDFSGRGENRQCEDVFIWHEDGRFCAIMRDMGVFNHEVGLWLESVDGIAWSEPKIAFRPVSAYVELPPRPKHLNRWGRLERPQLLLREGKPAYLFAASQGGRYETSSVFLFKIEQ
ncbi:glycoside hydrolase family protein [Oleiharenicola lentus]|uniref:glycoside hydrolase family protein n=1 Tax=Oleiharenicola lentus TaxID=2508720 RepID=UPI003F6765B3